MQSVNVLVNKNDSRTYRGTGVNRTTIMVIKYISADSRHLDPFDHMACFHPLLLRTDTSLSVTTCHQTSLNITCK